MKGAAITLVIAVGLVVWAYAGYPAWCFVRAKMRPRGIARRAFAPAVSVVIAAHREAGNIARKIESVAGQKYGGRIEVIVACDGSDDGTPEAARAAGERLMPGRVRVIALPERRGKPAALNAAVQAATGEVLVLTDARQPICDEAVAALCEDLADPEMGAVGGELVLDGGAPAGAYWRYEALLRRLEGEAGSTVGASGALWAMRRELWRPLPEETILDDVLQPMRVRLAGLRVGFEPRARAYDRAAESGREFRRKVRTLSGNFQLLLLEPRLLSPFSNPSWLDFVSHKLARLAVPYALLAILGCSALLPWPWAPILVGAQLLGYGLAAARVLGLPLPLSGLAETFVVLNAAAVAGLGRFVRHGRRLPW